MDQTERHHPASAAQADPSTPASARERALHAYALARDDELRDAFETLQNVPAWSYIRRPECGLVMLRGRIGGGGDPFNFGEATVTRAAITLETGETGFGMCLGRSRKKAAYAALFDALWQHAEWTEIIEEQVIAKILSRQGADDQRIAAEAEATKVDFFTLARGDD